MLTTEEINDALWCVNDVFYDAMFEMAHQGGTIANLADHLIANMGMPR